MEAPGDQEVVRRAREGDADAFRVLFEQYGGALRARIRAKLTPPLRRKMDASDVLQDAYVTALQRIHDFEDRGPGSFGRWLAVIVENKVSDVVRNYARSAKRRVGREVSAGGDGVVAEPPGREPSPSQAAMAGELSERAKAALGRLPPDHRRVIGLVQEQQLSYPEVAARMDRSEAAVKKLYVRALARFAQLLEGAP